MRVVLQIAVIVFAAELAIMAGFAIYGGMSIGWYDALLDAGLLTVMTSPIIYYWVIRPYVRQRDVAEQETKLAMAEVERTGRAKSDFLAGMGHELRTPLNTVIGFSEMISSQILGTIENSKYIEYAKDIASSGHHLLALVNDILDLSKIEAGKLTLDESEVRLAKVIHTSLALVRQQAECKGVILTRELSGTPPTIYGDERRPKQIVINLLSNAVKFSSKGDHVSIDAAICADGGLALKVSDTGAGIAAEDLPKVMEVFGQVPSIEAQSFEGSGLGLPLTKALAELHGGTIDIESALGVGTTVALRLPAKRVMAVRASAA